MHPIGKKTLRIPMATGCIELYTPYGYKKSKAEVIDKALYFPTE